MGLTRAKAHQEARCAPLLRWVPKVDLQSSSALVVFSKKSNNKGVVGGQKFGATLRRIKQALGPKRHTVYNQHRSDHDQAETELHAKARP